MKLKYIFVLLLLPQMAMTQQGFDAFLSSIEANNKTILSARKLADAKVLEANTGIYLSNPEFSYDYLMGKSENYSEMIVSQSFDFPTSYIHKNKIADISGQQALIEYRQKKLGIFREAATLYAQQIILNRKLTLFYELKGMMEQLKSNAEKKFQIGEINILEANRIRSEAARNNVELNMLEVDHQTLRLKISELNGGQTYEIEDTVFTSFLLPAHPDTLIQHVIISNPLTGYWKSELEKADREIQLQKSSSFPKFELGYRQDMLPGETFNGIHAGLSIPLFENKNTVQLSKARQLYVQERIETEQLAFRNQIRMMISEYETVSKSVREFEQISETLKTPELLMKSFQSGQINYTEFFFEYSYYRETLLFVGELWEQAVSLQMQLHVLTSY